MIKMLLRRLVNDNEAALNLQTRQRYGKVASWMGIFTNFLLFHENHGWISVQQHFHRCRRRQQSFGFQQFIYHSGRI